MLNWFKKEEKSYPEFWENYATQFSEKQPEALSEIRFVILDTETTGFNYILDRMLCIGAVCLKNQQIDIKNNFEVYINQKKFNPESAKIHGIIQNEEIKTYSEEEAVKKFLRYIGNSVLVAHHAGFDIGMINAALQRMSLPKLKNQVLDTGRLYRASRITSNLIDRNKNYSLDELAETFQIDIRDRHTAAGDAMITAVAFLKILSRLKEKETNLNLQKLLKY